MDYRGHFAPSIGFGREREERKGLLPCRIRGYYPANLISVCVRVYGFTCRSVCGYVCGYVRGYVCGYVCGSRRLSMIKWSICSYVG